MSERKVEEIRIGIDLNRSTTKKFLVVKEKLGIESNADVVRWLINWYFDRIMARNE